MNRKTSTKLVDEIHDYMKFRSKHEGRENDLDKDWFRKLLDFGVMNYFGVQLDENDLVEDTQNPEVFKTYMEK